MIIYGVWCMSARSPTCLLVYNAMRLGPLRELSDPEDPQMPEYALVPDDVARNFRRGYYAAVSSMDYNAGLLLDELKTLQLEEKTLVVFLGAQHITCTVRNGHIAVIFGYCDCVCLSAADPAGDHAWQLGDIGEFGKKTNFERATRVSRL